MKAALYARFSSDLQNVGSIADQLAACRAHAVRIGADVVATFEDAAISGASTANRPGLQALMRAARDGLVDVVIAEALDRLTRSGGDAWDIYEDLRACGVAISTIGEGDVGTLHIGLKGTMNSLFLEELARKTRRGLQGVAREGRHAGGRVYGYRRVRRLDDAGEPVPGLLEIDPAEADVVRRIFSDYAVGLSPRAIAAALNAEGVPGPRGGLWNASTINGNAARGNGVLHNALYAGELVWGRQTWVKDRRTGKRRSRAADPSQIQRTPVPELRIVDADLWTRAQAQYQDVARQDGPRAATRPKRLLSGLVRCGVCDGPMIHSGERLQCSVRREKGDTACANGRTARSVDVEARVIEAVRAQLLHPEVIEAAVEAYRQEAARLRADRTQGRAKLEKELAEVRRRAERLVDQVADGHLEGAAVADRLRGLEARRKELEGELEAAGDGAEVVVLHPAAGARYRTLVEDLQAALTGDMGIPMTEQHQGVSDRATAEEARQAFRALIEAVHIRPLEARGSYAIEISADLAPMLSSGQTKTPLAQADGVVVTKLGAGARSYRHNSFAVRLTA